MGKNPKPGYILFHVAKAEVLELLMLFSHPANQLKVSF